MLSIFDTHSGFHPPTHTTLALPHTPPQPTPTPTIRRAPPTQSRIKGWFDRILSPTARGPVREQQQQQELPIEQFVDRVVDFSSEYSSPAWGASRVCGPPRAYPAYGDQQETWAPRGYGPEYSKEFLVLAFRRPVHVEKVRIWETNCPGAVVRLSVAELPFSNDLFQAVPLPSAASSSLSPSLPPGDWAEPPPRDIRLPPPEAFTVIWSGTPQDAPKVSRIFEPRLKVKGVKAQLLRIDIDLTSSSTWYEVDAVSLVGVPAIEEAPPAEVIAQQELWGSTTPPSPPPVSTPENVGQWVSNVLDFSSQYGVASWAAYNVVGPPNVYPAFGDFAEAWAPSRFGENAESLVVLVDRPVRVAEVIVWETLEPGAVVRILALPLSPRELVETAVLGAPLSPPGADRLEKIRAHGLGFSSPPAFDEWAVLWSGETQFKDLSRRARIFRPELHRKDIELDTAGASTWPEIDAIQIRGSIVPRSASIADLYHSLPVPLPPLAIHGTSADQQSASPICSLDEDSFACIAQYLHVSALGRLAQTCRILNAFLRNDRFLKSRIQHLRILSTAASLAPLFGDFAFSPAVDTPAAAAAANPHTILLTAPPPPPPQGVYSITELVAAFGESMLLRPAPALCLHGHLRYGQACRCPPSGQLPIRRGGGTSHTVDVAEPPHGAYVEMPDTLLFFQAAHTIEMWFRVVEPVQWTAHAAIDSTAVQRERGGVLFGGQLLHATEAAPDAYWWNHASLYVGVDGRIRKTVQAADAPILTGPHVADGRWHHVAVTGDAVVQQLFVDGALHDACEVPLPSAEPDQFANHTVFFQIGTGLLATEYPGAPSYLRPPPPPPTDAGEAGGAGEENAATTSAAAPQQQQQQQAAQQQAAQPQPPAADWCAFTGDITEVRAWRTALCEADVRALMRVAIVGDHAANRVPLLRDAERRARRRRWERAEAGEEGGDGVEGGGDVELDEEEEDEDETTALAAEDVRPDVMVADADEVEPFLAVGGGGAVGEVDAAAASAGAAAGAGEPTLAASPRRFVHRHLLYRVSGGAGGCRYAGNGEPRRRAALLHRAAEEEWGLRGDARGSATVDVVRRRDARVGAVLQRRVAGGPVAWKGVFRPVRVRGGFVGTPWEAAGV
ncbi:hypothetical protein DFJ73DRAFT_899698 [Zopfochytrium polystomum]|nr:hypothetical protein DFJ73DRAFT_899698 [Zopfochytrium polystomum]